MLDVAQGTGSFAKSIQELSSRKACAAMNAPSAYIASRRFRIRPSSNTMTSNLPYFATDPKPSADGAVLQSRLIENAARTSNTAAGVHNSRSRFARAGSCAAKSSVERPANTSRNLERLMITIDNPTEAAARQMMKSRKSIVFLSKIVAVPAS